MVFNMVNGSTNKTSNYSALGNQQIPQKKMYLLDYIRVLN